MEEHIQDIAYAIGTILPIIGFMWKMLERMEQRINKRIDDLEKRFDKRFDQIEERMARIEQNHLDHMMALHAIPAQPPQPITEKENP